MCGCAANPNPNLYDNHPARPHIPVPTALPDLVHQSPQPSQGVGLLILVKTIGLLSVQTVQQCGLGNGCTGTFEGGMLPWDFLGVGGETWWGPPNLAKFFSCLGGRARICKVCRGRWAVVCVGWGGDLRMGTFGKVPCHTGRCCEYGV